MSKKVGGHTFAIDPKNFEGMSRADFDRWNKARKVSPASHARYERDFGFWEQSNVSGQQFTHVIRINAEKGKGGAKQDISWMYSFKSDRSKLSKAEYEEAGREAIKTKVKQGSDRQKFHSSKIAGVYEDEGQETKTRVRHYRDSYSSDYYDDQAW